MNNNVIIEKRSNDDINELSRNDSISIILEEHEEKMKTKLKEYIIDIYLKAMMEIDRKRFNYKLNNIEFRINYFLTTVFYLLFSKLHNGDKVKALELIEKLEVFVLNNKLND